MDNQKIRKLKKEIRILFFLAGIAAVFSAVLILYGLGAFTEPDNTSLPDAPCEEKGSIGTLSYEVSEEGVSCKKEALVYLPYGYETAECAYEVLYFFHGRKDDEKTAFSYEKIVNLLDNMISEKEIPPLIVVTPTWRDPLSDSRIRSEEAYEREAEEIRDSLVPAVDRTYRTIPEREGRMIAGVSYGSMIALQSGLIRNYGLFDTYGSFSGAWADAFSLRKAVSEGKKKGEELELLYCSNGNRDFTCGDHLIVMKSLDLLSQDVTEGENYCFEILPRGEHNWDLWERSLRDFLLKLSEMSCSEN